MSTTPTTRSAAKVDPHRGLKLTVSAIAIVVALVHVWCPELAIDAITFALLVCAALPWLAPLIKSVELPGGLKVELAEVKAVADRAEEAGLISSNPAPQSPEHSFQLVAEKDPNLALAGLRIEIERRLVRLSELHGIPAKYKGIGQLLRALDERGVLTAMQTSVLSDLTGLLNSAVHGAEVSSEAASQAFDIAPELLGSLDRMIQPEVPTVHIQADEPKFSKAGDFWIQP